MLANIVPKLEDCGPQELSNLWWALGTLRWRLGPAVQEELAAELRVNVLELNAGETAMVLWALARCAPAALCQLACRRFAPDYGCSNKLASIVH